MPIRPGGVEVGGEARPLLAGELRDLLCFVVLNGAKCAVGVQIQVNNINGLRLSSKIHNAGVGGSSPPVATTSIKHFSHTIQKLSAVFDCAKLVVFCSISAGAQMGPKLGPPCAQHPFCGSFALYFSYSVSIRQTPLPLFCYAESITSRAKNPGLRPEFFGDLMGWESTLLSHFPLRTILQNRSFPFRKQTFDIHQMLGP